MPVSTDQLFIILLDAGEEGSNSYNFCINRTLTDLAAGIGGLKDLPGVGGFTQAMLNTDDNGEDQTIVTVIFETQDNLPAIFGRIAYSFAHQLKVPYDDTLLFREVPGESATESLLSFMRLPDFSRRFPGIFDGYADAADREERVLADLEVSTSSM